jgi:hypothetical protein
MVRAIKPGYVKQPAVGFTAMIFVSCVLTTVGFATTAWLAVRAILATGL